MFSANGGGGGDRVLKEEYHTTGTTDAGKDTTDWPRTESKIKNEGDKRAGPTIYHE